MVWHTHMLNPRAYLEDCIRSGHRAIWHRGIPWRTVNSAIDASLAYTVSEDARRRWESSTGLPWENTECPMTKGITCPACSIEFDVPWTTWNPDTSRPTSSDFAGHGFGDGGFSATCPDESCSYVTDKETLSVAKFKNDRRKLLKDGIPMAGTVLNLSTGLPSIGETDYGDHTFPNQLLHRHASLKFGRIFWREKATTMETVKSMVGEALEDLKPLSDLDDTSEGRGGRLFLKRHSGMATRKMLSRYVGNHSAMALDLVAAVLRQSAFIDKMFKVASPSPHPRSLRPQKLTRLSKARLAAQPRRHVDNDPPGHQVHPLH